DAELVRERGGVETAGAAEREQRESTRIESLTDRDQPDALSHLRIDDAVDAERGLLDRQSERPRDPLLDDLPRPLWLELQTSAGEIAGIDVAEDDRCIGD